MNSPLKTLYAAALLAASTLFAVAGFAADAASPQDTPAADAKAAGQPAPAAKPASETPLHEIGQGAPAAPAAQPAVASPTAPAAPAPSAVPAAPVAAAPDHRHGSGDDEGNDRVSVQGATYVGADEAIEGNAVAVMGPVTVDGTVNGNAVAVMGKNTINGTVHGNVVAVLGNLKLGPKASVDGNAVCVGGIITKDPGAHVAGHIVKQASVINFSDDSAASSWWEHGLSKGRPIAFGPHMLFFWFFNLCLVALYVLVSLAFPGGITKCGETLARRPGITFLTGVLSILALPVLFILLLITVVGIPVALIVLPLAILAATLFGKAAVYAFIGHSIFGKKMHPAVAVLAGVAVLIILYFVPILGLALWFLVSFLGFACAVTTLFSSRSQPTPAAPAPAAPVPPAAAAAPVSPVTGAVPLAFSGEPPIVGSTPPTATLDLPADPQAPAVVPPPLAPSPEPVAAAPAVAPPPPAAAAGVHTQVGLPRAGFWIRMVALLLDIILVAVVTSGLEHTTVHIIGHHDTVSFGGSLFPLAIAAYGAVLWKLKGSTIGGIIFGLSVVRADDRPMDWTTTIVRALACFFSMIAIGLGFLWIAFDPEKQAWHDKIAGTVVVRLPKSVSLI